jgi:hypothetical protein
MIGSGLETGAARSGKEFPEPHLFSGLFSRSLADAGRIEVT